MLKNKKIFWTWPESHELRDKERDGVLIKSTVRTAWHLFQDMIKILCHWLANSDFCPADSKPYENTQLKYKTDSNQVYVYTEDQIQQSLTNYWQALGKVCPEQEEYCFPLPHTQVFSFCFFGTSSCIQLVSQQLTAPRWPLQPIRDDWLKGVAHFRNFFFLISMQWCWCWCVWMCSFVCLLSKYFLNQWLNFIETLKK